jgi:hypothetical protein
MGYSYSIAGGMPSLRYSKDYRVRPNPTCGRAKSVVLFYLYTKARREDLSPEQLKRLRQAANIIKQEFKQ